MNLLPDNKLARRLIAIIAGALVPFAFAPFNFYFISFISLSALFYLWYETESTGETFILGYLFGFAMFGIGVSWLHISINLFGGMNIIGAYFFTFLLIAFISLYPALCGYLASRFFKQYYYLTLPALWLVTEWCRGWILTGFPWLNLGTSQTNSLLASFAPVIGDYGISFIVCVIAISITIFMRGNLKPRLLSSMVIILIIISSFILTSINWTENKGKDLSITLIQGAIPQEIKWNPEYREKTYEIYSGLSKPYWSSDLIIWPETAIPSYYHQADDFISRITVKQKLSNTLFMSGIVNKNQSTNKYFNSILLIDKQHRFYNKNHLVPFGEYLPFKILLDRLLRFLQIPMSDFSSGDSKDKLLETDKAIFGMSICYEDAYGTEVRQALPDADILINVSNDAWFGDSIAPHQHLQIARMRAMENGRYLLRSTNTGISAVIDDKGKVIARSPQFEPHALHAKAALFVGQSPYSKYGNNIILSFSFLILFSGFIMQHKLNKIKPK
ncbi:MAG: apolipoprotein N-acyltransferase [Proteobacteria bacterium]|nr:apolipoprotein N-acyltransferase [Pseudomonadota bacterium]NOG61105.1 apolipoprotein N-acyltransferase [Pseudomonadota bacterium]